VAEKEDEMSASENPLQEHLQWIVPVCIVLGVVWVVSTYQRGEQNRERERIREKELEATEAIRKPFEPMLREVPQLVSSVRQEPWNSVGERDLEAVPRPAMPCIVVDVTLAPEIWPPWCSYPSGVRAHTIADVKSIILLERQRVKDKVYPYKRGHAYMERQGYRTDLRLWIIDWKSKQILSGGVVRGQALPASVEQSITDFTNSDVIGEPPDIRTWLVP
jgi:hypothetical protein